MFKKIISYLSFSACCFASGPDVFLTELSIPYTYPIAGVQFVLSLDYSPPIRKKTQFDESIDELEKKVINLLNHISLTDEKLETIAPAKMQSVAYCWSFSPLTLQFTQKLQEVLKTPSKENFFTKEPLELFKRFYEENQKNKKTLSSLKNALEVIECLSPESPVKTEVLKELREFIKKKEAEIKPGSILVLRNSIFF